MSLRHGRDLNEARGLYQMLNIGETAVDSLCGKLATYFTSTVPR